VLGLLGAAFGIGFTVGPAIGGIAAWLGGQRAPFYVASALAFINGIVAIRRLPETRRAGEAGASVPRRRWLAIGTFAELRRLVIIGFLTTAAFSGFEATFALLADHRFSLTESGVAFVFVGVGVGSSVIQGGGIGPLTARFGSARLLQFGITANLIGLVVLAAAESWSLLLLALVFLVVGQGLATPSITALVANRAGERRRGAALGEQQSAGALARVAGPALAGVLFDVRIPLPYLVGAALMALALVTLRTDSEPA
jgi:MFS family permease